MKLAILCTVAVLLHCISSNATFIEPFRFFFWHFFATHTTTTTASSSAINNITNVSVTYNQNISIVNSTDTMNVGIASRSLRHNVGPNLTEFVDSDFYGLSNCFNEHAASYLETVTDVEQNMEMCVSGRLLEVVGVAKSVLQALDQMLVIEEDRSGETTELHFVKDAQSTMTQIMSERHKCSKDMASEIDAQSLSATNALEKCTLCVEKSTATV